MTYRITVYTSYGDPALTVDVENIINHNTTHGVIVAETKNNKELTICYGLSIATIEEAQHDEPVAEL